MYAVRIPAYDLKRIPALGLRDGPVRRAFGGRWPDAVAQRAITTLQINIGKMCNLACHHCHVEAGPNRTEIMDWPTMEKIVGWLKLYKDELGIEVVDLTGGAPEMNPHFHELVIAVRALGLRHRPLQPDDPAGAGVRGYGRVPDRAQVEVSASLPCYLEDNVDKQRGRGVYGGSIKALQMLNGLGYGQDGTGLKLDLVYNPVGYGLPPGTRTARSRL
ncbi:MAG: radical SAM protein [Phycisphaerales bacterium]